MLRASSDKKPFGFGAHVTAGGLEGAMEAVCPTRSCAYSTFKPFFSIVHPATQLRCPSPDTIKVRMRLSKAFTFSYSIFEHENAIELKTESRELGWNRDRELDGRNSIKLKTIPSRSAVVRGARIDVKLTKGFL